MPDITAYKKRYPERYRQSQARYDAGRRKERAGEERLEKFLDLEFIAWDGEGSEVPDGTPQPYMLFGNTNGLSIQAEQLPTEDCLNLICRGRTESNVVNFAFAFNYDVNQILWQVPSWRMERLLRTSRVRYKGFRIEWVPGKWFSVRRTSGGKQVKIYDVFHFFNCALVTDDPLNPGALDKFNIGTPAQRKWLAEQKKARPQFRWEEIRAVKKYWTLEGKLMVELMARVRDIFGQAGFYIRTWHGPGALARFMLNAHKIKQAQSDLRETYPGVWNAACYAFSAGRFEQFRAGLYLGGTWVYDIHSAFPYAIQFLPDLSNGYWRHSFSVDRTRIGHDRFALYQINYRQSASVRDISYPNPLFRRLRNDNICWPDRVSGWYWSPEAELVADDPNAEFIESWEFIGDGSRPMAWMADIYDTRERLKSNGDPMEYAFKLGMNSCYGQFAQRAGWKNQREPGPPPFHQLEWAGYITSMCKSMVFRVAQWAAERGSLVTIDTDAVCSTTRIPAKILPNGIGNRLGQWEESHYDGILLIQSGFYWLKNGDSWKKCRSRGAPRGTVPIEAGWECLRQAEELDRFAMVRYDKHMFCGYGMAKQLGHFGLWRSWTTKEIELIFGGRGKRQHHIRWCPKCVKKKFGTRLKYCDDQLHLLRPEPHAPNREYWQAQFENRHDDYWSKKHRLPWVDYVEEVPEDEMGFDVDTGEIWEDISL